MKRYSRPRIRWKTPFYLPLPGSGVALMMWHRDLIDMVWTYQSMMQAVDGEPT